MQARWPSVAMCVLPSPLPPVSVTCAQKVLTLCRLQNHTPTMCMLCNPPPGLPLANMQPPQPSHPNQGPPPKWRSGWFDWWLVVAKFINNQCTQPRQPPHCLPHHTMLEGSGLNSPLRNNILVGSFVCGVAAWRLWLSWGTNLVLGCFGLWPTH